mgnify:CR=1 FL=1
MRQDTAGVVGPLPNVLGMPSPRFRARDDVRDPDDFANPAVFRPRWVLPPGGQEAFLWASVVHHLHARAIRRAFEEDGRFQSLKHLCRARHLPYKVIVDMLNGTSALRMEVIGGVAFHLGPGSLVSPAEIDKALDQAANDIGVARPPRP